MGLYIKAPDLVPFAQPFLALHDVPNAEEVEYKEAEDVEYSPEGALKMGLYRVKGLFASLRRAELGTELRKEVWMESLKE